MSSLVPTGKSWPVYSLGSRPHRSPEQARTTWKGLTGILAQSKSTTLRLLRVKSLSSALCSPHNAGGRPGWDLMSKPCGGQLCICCCWLVLSVFLQSDGCLNSHPQVYRTWTLATNLQGLAFSDRRPPLPWRVLPKDTPFHSLRVLSA